MLPKKIISRSTMDTQRVIYQSPYPALSHQCRLLACKSTGSHVLLLHGTGGRNVKVEDIHWETKRHAGVWDLQGMALDGANGTDE